MRTKKPLLSRDLKAIKAILFEKTGRTLKDFLIEQTFTRSSYSKRYGGGDNENLEFIGDTILGYHIVRQLYNHYGIIYSDEEKCIYTFRAHEKDFTALKSIIVSNNTLAAIVDEWNVCQYLIVGQSDIDNEIDKQVKIKADLFEAIIGAYAVQYKWSQSIMYEIISKILPIEQYIMDYEKAQFRLPEFSADNAVNTLKELAEHDRCSFPEYDIIGPEILGYDKSGNPRWLCRCIVKDKGISMSVFANSKKEAKKYVSYLVLCEMFELPNEYGQSKQLPMWYFHDGKLTVEEPEDFKFAT